jgi:hypothetical protein
MNVREQGLLAQPTYIHNIGIFRNYLIPFSFFPLSIISLSSLLSPVCSCHPGKLAPEA